MSSAIETAKTFLTEDRMTFHEQDGGLVLTMSDDCGTWTTRIAEVNECLLCSAIFPVRAPDAVRPAVAELLARINWGLVVGNWELDWSDGEVRYRTSMPLRNCPLTPAQARDVCYINFSTFTRSWGLLLDVIHGTHTPLEALDAARRRGEKERKEFADAMSKAGFEEGEGDPGKRAASD